MHFSKYHGAGNDFVIIDDRNMALNDLSDTNIARICDRHFGVGADGLMLLRERTGYDFEMVYFNSDGNESSMCGNGGRCLVDFAKKLGMFKKAAKFLAVDGDHKAEWLSDGVVKLEMGNVQNIEEINSTTVFLDTGSPHVVKQVTDLTDLDILAEAHKIRYASRFSDVGVNVNFVEWRDGSIQIRTYERGVENETLACGTGVTAAAIAFHHWKLNGEHAQINAVGGNLSVEFEFSDNRYSNVWKTGPVEHVFDGIYNQ